MLPAAGYPVSSMHRIAAAQARTPFFRGLRSTIQAMSAYDHCALAFYRKFSTESVAYKAGSGSELLGKVVGNGAGDGLADSARHVQAWAASAQRHGKSEYVASDAVAGLAAAAWLMPGMPEQAARAAMAEACAAWLRQHGPASCASVVPALAASVASVAQVNVQQAEAQLNLGMAMLLTHPSLADQNAEHSRAGIAALCRATQLPEAELSAAPARVALLQGLWAAGQHAQLVDIMPVIGSTAAARHSAGWYAADHWLLLARAALADANAGHAQVLVGVMQKWAHCAAGDLAASAPARLLGQAGTVHALGLLIGRVIRAPREGELASRAALELLDALLALPGAAQALAPAWSSMCIALLARGEASACVQVLSRVAAQGGHVTPSLARAVLHAYFTAQAQQVRDTKRLVTPLGKYKRRRPADNNTQLLAAAPAAAGALPGFPQAPSAPHAATLALAPQHDSRPIVQHVGVQHQSWQALPPALAAGEGSLAPELQASSWQGLLRAAARLAAPALAHASAADWMPAQCRAAYEPCSAVFSKTGGVLPTQREPEPAELMTPAQQLARSVPSPVPQTSSPALSLDAQLCGALLASTRLAPVPHADIAAAVQHTLQQGMHHHLCLPSRLWEGLHDLSSPEPTCEGLAGNAPARPEAQAVEDLLAVVCAAGFGQDTERCLLALDRGAGLLQAATGAWDCAMASAIACTRDAVGLGLITEALGELNNPGALVHAGALHAAVLQLLEAGRLASATRCLLAGLQHPTCQPTEACIWAVLQGLAGVWAVSDFADVLRAAQNAGYTRFALVDSNSYMGILNVSGMTSAAVACVLWPYLAQARRDTAEGRPLPPRLRVYGDARARSAVSSVLQSVQPPVPWRMAGLNGPWRHVFVDNEDWASWLTTPAAGVQGDESEAQWQQVMPPSTLRWLGGASSITPHAGHTPAASILHQAADDSADRTEEAASPEAVAAFQAWRSQWTTARQAAGVAARASQSKQAEDLAASQRADRASAAQAKAEASISGVDIGSLQHLGITATGLRRKVAKQRRPGRR